MTAKDAKTVKMEYKKMLDGLYALNDTLERHGEQGAGPDEGFFFGKQYTLAESHTAPRVVRMQPLFKENRGVDIFESIQELGFHKLAKWWKAVEERPSTILTSPTADSLKHMAPYVRVVWFPYTLSAAEQA